MNENNSEKSNPKQDNSKTTRRLNDESKEIYRAIGEVVLGAAMGGVIAAVLVTIPGISIALAPFLKQKKWQNRDNVDESISEALNKFKKDRLVEVIHKKDKDYLKITSRGRRRLVDYNIDTITIHNQKWDGRWRLVIFDIPEKLRFARRVLRDKLKEIGFQRLQQSVWISPYECQDEISFISSVYGVERYVHYLIVSNADNLEYLKTKFSLFKV